MFAAKSAAPAINTGIANIPLFEQAANQSTTLFIAPPGYLFTDHLAAILAARDQPMLWLRIGHEDCDPATLLISLIKAAQRLRPGFGARTLAFMQRNPGPLSGWNPHFSQLAGEMVSNLPSNCALVIEHLDLLNDNQPLLSLLVTQLIASMPASMPCILIAHEALPATLLPVQTNLFKQQELEITDNQALELADDTDLGLPDAFIRRVNKILKGQEVTLRGIFEACTRLGPEYLQWLARQSKNQNQLLTQIARASLRSVEQDVWHALVLTLCLEYSNPGLLEAVLGKGSIPDGPWVQLLADRWARIRCTWATPLKSALRIGSDFNQAFVRRAADYLVQQGDHERAAGWYLEIGAFDRAAESIDQIAEIMLNQGQWFALGNWLKQLPPEVMHAWPWLMCVQGEILAACGHSGEARRVFASAAKIFSDQHLHEGTCQCLLAESALAAWDDHYGRAQLCASTAHILAQSNNLNLYNSIAYWQLGRLAMVFNKPDDAQTYFYQAGQTSKDPYLSALFSQAQLLAQRCSELNSQSNAYQQAYITTRQSAHETQESLCALTNSLPENLPDILGSFGWSKIPLMLKLSNPSDVFSSEKTGWGARLLSLLGFYRRSSRQPGFVPPDQFSPMDLTFGIQPLTVSAQPNKRSTSIARDIPPLIDQQALVPAFPASDINSFSPEESELPVLSAQMLGAFRCLVSDSEIQKWPGARGLAVFKYLLAHHGQSIPREVLMETFWREVDPVSARNNLNVSLHSLRSSLRELTTTPIVLFEKGHYFTNPEILIWVDYEEFERHLQAGNQLEVTGQLGPAIKEYEVAASLYQGDFLAEDLYEEWPVLTRERLRVAHLDMLDHLSEIYFSQHQYAACVALCQQILDHDNCREDAHCRLMRCYSRQGQQYLALRQYQTCVESLRSELEVDPDPATTQLAERLRRHEKEC